MHSTKQCYNNMQYAKLSTLVNLDACGLIFFLWLYLFPFSDLDARVWLANETLGLGWDWTGQQISSSKGTDLLVWTRSVSRSITVFLFWLWGLSSRIPSILKWREQSEGVTSWSVRADSTSNPFVSAVQPASKIRWYLNYETMKLS